MEVIGYDTSSLTALFMAGRPQGQFPLIRSMGELVKRYSFAVVPKIEQLDSPKVEFRLGQFKDLGIESFSIYGDGVVITSKVSTDVLDDFLDDVCKWMESALGLRRIETHTINRSYESGLFVRSEAKLLRALDALAPIQEMIEKSVKSAMGLEAKFESFGISFAADHSLIPGMKPGMFRVERRAGLGFDTDYYVSTAPMRTADHLKILAKLEKLA